MTRMEESSKSLNEILRIMPETDKIKIRQWWRGKMKLSFLMAFLCGGIGFCLGFLINCKC